MPFMMKGGVTKHAYDLIDVFPLTAGLIQTFVWATETADVCNPEWEAAGIDIRLLDRWFQVVTNISTSTDTLSYMSHEHSKETVT